MKIKHAFNQHSLVLFTIPGFLLLITLFSGFVLVGPLTYANNDKTSNVAVIVNAACSIITGGGAYSKTISPGTSEEITGSGINVSCNDSSGYALYAVGFSGDSYTAPNNTRMLALTGTNYISTGTSGSDSYWAMKATGSSTTGNTPIIDNSYSSFQVIPSAYTKVSHYASSTIGATTNSVTTPTYKVYVSNIQSPSTYIGKVKYTLVHPHDIDTNVYMQNWAGCSNLKIGDSTFLMDSRDNKIYNIVKYNDGKCWMTTNLDLAGGTALSSTDTDFDSTYTLPTTNGWTVSGGKLIMPPSDNSSTSFSIENYAYVYNAGRYPTSDSGCTSPGCYSYYSWDTATLGSGRSISADNTDAPYSICPEGWRLPNTRSGNNSIADFRRLMITLGGTSEIAIYNAETSPTGDTIFGALSNTSLYFLRAGYYRSGSFKGGGGSGVYWSSTSVNNTIAHYLNISSGYVGSANNDPRRSGFSVRCLTE